MSETSQAGIDKSARLMSEAEDIIKRKTLYAAGAGLIPFPILDVATLLGVQLTMIRSLADLYGQSETFQRTRVKAIVTTLIGDLGALGVVSGIKALPVVGSIIGVFTAPVTGAAATYALGKVFTQHFDQGGTLLDFDTVTSRQQFYAEFQAGKDYVNGINQEEGGGEAVSTTEITDINALKQELNDGISRLNDLISKLEAQEAGTGQEEG